MAILCNPVTNRIILSNLARYTQGLLFTGLFALLERVLIKLSDSKTNHIYVINIIIRHLHAEGHILEEGSLNRAESLHITQM